MSSPRRRPAPGAGRSDLTEAAERLLEVAKALVEKARRLDKESRHPERRATPPCVRTTVSRRRPGAAAAVTVDLSAVAERTIAATVQIEHGETFGSGFIVHPDGLVVTARHVVETQGRSLRTVKVRLADKAELTGTIVRSHPILDFALMWLDPGGPFPHVPLGRASRLRPAETVLAVGHPFQFRNTVSKGIVGNPAAEVEGLVFVQTDTAIDPGNSGGPLVNTRGEVVGINLWIVRGAGSAKFALPIDYLRDEIDRVAGLGRPACLERPYCRWCGAMPDTARWYCPTCGAQDFERDASSGDGTAQEGPTRLWPGADEPRGEDGKE